LLELEKPIRIDLIALIELEYQLSDLLGVKVDLVIKDNLKPRIEKHVIREVVSV
jgi:predicted nucleotidyltransferase